MRQIYHKSQSHVLALQGFINSAIFRGDARHRQASPLGRTRVQQRPGPNHVRPGASTGFAGGFRRAPRGERKHQPDQLRQRAALPAWQLTSIACEPGEAQTGRSPAGLEPREAKLWNARFRLQAIAHRLAQAAADSDFADMPRTALPFLKTAKRRHRRPSPCPVIPKPSANNSEAANLAANRAW
jgi:hypothetical protein